MSLSKAIDEILSCGYRDITLTPQPDGKILVYARCGFSRIWCGCVGFINQSGFFDEIPF